MITLTDAISFPHPESNTHSDVLATGGDLSVERLLLAYHYGIFPWYDISEPKLWWSPRMRFVLLPSDVRVTKSMRNVINQGKFRHTFDQAFDQVITACAEIKRPNQPGDSGWLLQEMIDAYTRLHKLGYAHSVEVWDKENNLVGGLYGVSIGKCFFGESMFSRQSNASKYGFISLCRHLTKLGYDLIDGQMPNNHLASLGFRYVDRSQFIAYLRNNHFVSSKF